MSEARLSLNYEGISWECFQLEVDKPENSLSPHIVTYCPSTNADRVAKLISAQFTNHPVKLVKMARIKALYLNGERIKLNDYHDFYLDLSETQHEATKLYLEDKGEWA